MCGGGGVGSVGSGVGARVSVGGGSGNAIATSMHACIYMNKYVREFNNNELACVRLCLIEN